MKTNKLSKPRAGRPSFAIDPHRLRQLRESKGWSQTELAERVYERLGKGNHSSLATMKNSYRRWEKSGRLPRKTAEALSDVLGVTVDVLCGAAPEAPPSRIDEIEARIHEQLAIGNAVLAGHLKEKDDPTAIKDLAQRLETELEYAQLSQDADEFKRLSQILGASISELQQPVGANGHWMLICNGHNLPVTPEIIHGIHELLQRFDEHVLNCLDFPGEVSDVRVTLKQESTWFRIHFSHPVDPVLDSSLSFVRCQASETGLLWTKPAWTDDCFIQDLPRRLSRYVNYVCGFDQQELGPSDLANLKLAIYRLPTYAEVEEQGGNAPSTLVTLTNGCLDERWDRLSFSLDAGRGHDEATTLLCCDLLEVLQPLLCEWPLRYWKFEAIEEGAIVVELDAPAFLALKRGRTDFWEYRFRIDLVEESTDGDLRRVPWRRKSVEKTLERIQHHLKRELTERDARPDASPSIT